MNGIWLTVNRLQTQPCFGTRGGSHKVDEDGAANDEQSSKLCSELTARRAMHRFSANQVFLSGGVVMCGKPVQAGLLDFPQETFKTQKNFV